MITQQIKLNLIPGQVFPRVNASQYDSGTRTLQMALYNGDQVFNIASGMIATVQGTKPDKTGFQYAATITEGSNIATLDITQQMTAVSGEVVCELVISSGDDRIATVNFILFIEAAALADDTVISETDLPLIEEAVEAVQRIVPIAQQVAEDAQTASDAATAATAAQAAAEEAAEEAEAWGAHPPYIGQNGNWYIYNTTTQQFEDSGVEAQGPQGETGPQGPQGVQGETGPQGPTGATGNGISSITKTSTSGLVDTYTILFTDGTTTTFTVTNGQDGQGTGDMTKAVYDPDDAVADAGGIVAYVQAHSGAGTLAGLDDVTLSNLAAGDTLIYNATTQKWENSVAIRNLTNQVADMNNVLGAKNLLPNKAISQTSNGITYTINSDGSVTVNGTATANTAFIINDIFRPKSGTYIVSGQGLSNATNMVLAVDTYNGSTYVKRLTLLTKSKEHDTITVDYDGYDNIRVFVYVESGKTETNLNIKPMIRLASIQDDTYEPYSMTNQQMTPYVQAISNPNLLDNPWFTVNQRGQNSYIPNHGNYYTVDRWGIENASSGDAELTVNADGSITFTNNSSSETRFFSIQSNKQEFGIVNVGDIYTISINVLSYSGTCSVLAGLENSSPFLNWGSFTVSKTGINSKVCTVPVSYNQGNSFRPCTLILSVGASITIKAVKLERGSVSTLAIDTAPNYEQELAKCQRFFVRNGSASDVRSIGVGQAISATACMIVVPLPVTLRTGVSHRITVNDYPKIQLRNGGVYKDATNVTIDASGVGVQNILVESTGLTIGACYDCFIKSGGALDISADF